MRMLKVVLLDCILLVLVFFAFTSIVTAEVYVVTDADLALKSNVSDSFGIQLNDALVAVLTITALLFIGSVIAYIFFETLLLVVRVAKKYLNTPVRNTEVSPLDEAVRIKKRAPEAFLLRIADLLPKKQRQILRQEAINLREEYDEALTFGKVTRAKVIVLSYYIGVCQSVCKWIADICREIIKAVPK